MAAFNELDYYKSLPDYEKIAAFLDLDEPLPEFESDATFQPNYDCAICIEGIPVTTKEKVPKLTQLMIKTYGQISPGLNSSDIDIPFNEDAGATYGFCFVKFKSKEEAEHALKTTQGFEMDKKHKFKVFMFGELDRIAETPDEFVPPPPPAPGKLRPDPMSWLTDEHCRDQFVARYSHETEISWANMSGEEPNLVYGGDREKLDGKSWCESQVCWSSQGTYLATFHSPGIKLWGGDKFESQGRFMHAGVELLEFSPCETYMITYRFAQRPEFDPEEAIILWEISTGAKLRTFSLRNPLEVKYQVKATVQDVKTVKTTDKITNVEVKGIKTQDRVIRGRVVAYVADSDSLGTFTIEDGNERFENVPFNKVESLQEPNKMKWSADGQYFARLMPDAITVFSMDRRSEPRVMILEKKSIASKDVLDFVWSPANNMISCWSPAVGNHPAIISIIKVPGREELCSRKLFDVVEGRMLWQNEGEYLCVSMIKMQNKKRTTVLTFFRVSEAGVPVDQLELTETVHQCYWEPAGDRFVIILGDPRSPTISFYSMSGTSTKAGNKGRKEVTVLFSLSGVQCNEIHWSPVGSVVALAYFTPDSCTFQLHDIDNNVNLGVRRHERSNKLTWDPSGRVLASCTITELRNSHVRPVLEDGFNLYSFQGNLLSHVRKEKLFNFFWRPRPKEVLSLEARKAVIKNLKKYEKLFEKEDRQRRQELNVTVLAQRRKLAEDFMELLSRNRQISASLKAKRIALRDGFDTDDDSNYRFEVQVTETVESSKDQVLH